MTYRKTNKTTKYATLHIYVFGIMPNFFRWWDLCFEVLVSVKCPLWCHYFQIHYGIVIHVDDRSHLKPYNSFLSLSVFGLLSSSLLWLSQRFGRYVLWPSSGVCRTRETTWNFKIRTLLNPRGSPVLIQLAC